MQQDYLIVTNLSKKLPHFLCLSPQDLWPEWKASWSRWLCAGGRRLSGVFSPTAAGRITFPLSLLHPWGGTSQSRQRCCDWQREVLWAGLCRTPPPGGDRRRRALPVQLQHSKLCELWAELQHRWLTAVWAANHHRQPITCAEELRARPPFLWCHPILTHRPIRYFCSVFSGQFLLSRWF